MRRRSRRARWADPDRPKRQHQCRVCGAVGAWGRSWLWYGSFKGMDDGDPIVITCSDRCRADAKAQGLVPKNAQGAPNHE